MVSGTRYSAATIIVPKHYKITLKRIQGGVVIYEDAQNFSYNLFIADVIFADLTWGLNEEPVFERIYETRFAHQETGVMTPAVIKVDHNFDYEFVADNDRELKQRGYSMARPDYIGASNVGWQVVHSITCDLDPSTATGSLIVHYELEYIGPVTHKKLNRKFRIAGAI